MKDNVETWVEYIQLLSAVVGLVTGLITGLVALAHAIRKRFPRALPLQHAKEAKGEDEFILLYFISCIFVVGSAGFTTSSPQDQVSETLTVFILFAIVVPVIVLWR